MLAPSYIYQTPSLLKLPSPKWGYNHTPSEQPNLQFYSSSALSTITQTPSPKPYYHGPSPPWVYQLDTTTLLLKYLQLPPSLQSLTSQPYPHTKRLVNTAADNTQQREWHDQINAHKATWPNLHITKPHWGIDPFLPSSASFDIAVLFQLRAGLFPLNTDLASPCPGCPCPYPTLDHWLWTCPRNTPHRSALCTSLLNVNHLHLGRRSMETKPLA